ESELALPEAFPRGTAHRLSRGSPRAPRPDRGSDPAAARRALALAGGAHHGLHLEELLEAEDAPFAAVAGLLVAAERRGEVGAGAVQVHVAGAQPRRYALRVLEVARAHVARQPV